MLYALAWCCILSCLVEQLITNSIMCCLSWSDNSYVLDIPIRSACQSAMSLT